MLVELVQVTWYKERGKSHLQLGKVYVNTKHIVSVRPDKEMDTLLREGRLITELDPSHNFSVVAINSGDHTQDIRVVGSPALIAEKCSKEKILLKG